MISKSISLFFFVLLVMPACTRPVQNEDHDHAEDPTAVESRRGQGERRGTRAVGRRGQGGRGRQSPRQFDPVALTNEESRAIELETVGVSYRPLKAELSAMGKVVALPRTKAIVIYAFPARISEVHVRLGDWVKKGDQLITLQSEEVGTAKSEFFKARADYELAEMNYERQKRLFDRGVGAQKDLLASEAQLTVARSSWDSAEKKLHVLGFTEEHIRETSETHQVNPVVSLYAPISGKVVEMDAVLGDMVDQANEILTIMNPNLLRVDVEIYEKDIAKIRLGQEVEVGVQAYPNDVFQGKLQYISDIFKEDTRTVTVHTEVENHDYKLKPGMFADIKIRLNGNGRVMVLPKSAILDDQDAEIVFVMKGDHYMAQVVETGIQEADFVQILSGVDEGDQVVTLGNFQLKSKLYEDILKKAHVH